MSMRTAGRGAFLTAPSLIIAAVGLMTAAALTTRDAAAAAIARFESNVTVDVVLLSDLPTGVTVTHLVENLVASQDSSGVLSDAAADADGNPAAVTPMARHDSNYQAQTNTGQAGASRPAGVLTGVATANSQSDGYITVENGSGQTVTLSFEWAAALHGLVELLGAGEAEDAGASAFIDLLIMVSDGLTNQTVKEGTYTLDLRGNTSLDTQESASFAVTVPVGEARDIAILVRSGGTSNAVPAPAPLALLMAGGLIGLVGRRLVVPRPG